ncbi:hypothetical protein BDN70DRAFT_873937 [Pholiota conissans]|uniref:MATH domain-containing protein n=1 Tax=Pholiota conissans TaxID=109636 RepID=A0A9P6D5A1_9AGAR|nr:hypothetical protein BDN70DRAFT_873937 [Pholiota conissans]
MNDTVSEYSESSVLTFEWTLRGLKNLFDSTKGDKKSKVTKSIRFGNNQWQILFYANAGQTKEGADTGGFVSLYLSCEPTPEEKEAALPHFGKWVREGVYKFSFELRNVNNIGNSYNSKEAHNHSFTWKTANWGWAQFARRDTVYYQSMPVKNNDSFVIVCTIASSPSKPPAITIPRQPVPRALLDTVGSLLDDPVYSDVQFIIPKRGQSLSNGRRIWASKKLLKRADYFQTMFGSNFAEGSNQPKDIDQTPKTSTRDIKGSPPQLNILLDEFEDSDNEFDDGDRSDSTPDNLESSTAGHEEMSMLMLDTHSADSHSLDWDRLDEGMQSSDSQVSSPQIQALPPNADIQNLDAPKDYSKLTIIVKDAAYTTYHSMLYYIYTDNIVFAPLSSSFIGLSGDGTTVTPIDTSIPSTPSEGSQMPSGKRFSHQDVAPMLTRADWIREWMRVNPGRPAPCSAKSIYRIADRLDLSELKDRAAEHITKSLTVENIAYEVFSPFAAAFEAIRKVEINFFLAHWQEIRASDTMKHVWIQIRNGRHPGFEEVWPVIVQSLEFKPSKAPSVKDGEQ